MHQILSYITFLLTSTNQHGVHSPFVYDLVTKCFYDKTIYSEYKKLKHYRKLLSTSKERLEVKDFGAGSKQLDAHSRKVSDMVKTSSSSLKDTKLLFRLSSYFKFKSTLELGTSLGVGTQALAIVNNTHRITTLEGCYNTLKFTTDHFKNMGLDNVSFINSDFKTAISKLKDVTYDCVFFDGHHNKAATLDYFNSLITSAHNDSVFIFDDMYWSKGMTEAWEEIINDPRITVSIDTFYLGFVFFRKEQPKQHFKIRV